MKEWLAPLAFALMLVILGVGASFFPHRILVTVNKLTQRHRSAISVNTKTKTKILSIRFSGIIALLMASLIFWLFISKVCL
jgi:hypothetical protein